MTNWKNVSSADLIEVNDLFEMGDTASNISIDTNLSQRYPITLNQARDRAVKSIERSREQNSLSIGV